MRCEDAPVGGTKAEIYIKTAVTDTDRLDHFGVRHEGFQQETLYDGPHAASPHEVDALDALTAARTHLTAYVCGKPVGAVRVLWGHPALARLPGWKLGLPIEALYDLGPLAETFVLAEPGRLVVLPEYQNTGVALHLIDAVFQECRQRGVSWVVAPANTQTSHADDARMVLRVMRAKGLFSQRFHLSRKTPVEEAPPSSRKPFYGPNHRLRAAEGGLAGLPIPRALRLYTRLGAKVAGEEVFDDRFGLFALPIVLPIPERSILPCPRT